MEVKITVSGTQGAGKSAIAQSISNLLTSHGFITKTEGQVVVRDPERLAVCMRSLADLTMVTIVEQGGLSVFAPKGGPVTGIKGIDV